MDISLFDFDLPEALIALRPMEPREAARLLHLPASGAIEDHRVGDLPQLLRAGDALVFNDSRVLPVQLSLRQGNATLGVTLVERAGDNLWWAYVRNARRVKLNAAIALADGIHALALDRDSEGRILWRFELDGPIEAQLGRIGAMPLPPYIASRRKPDAQDMQDYQTVYARHDGSVAAPTAGLHFTPALLERLDARGIHRAHVTLHVGPGTFLPVKVDDTSAHVMHSEWAQLDEATASRLNSIRANGGRIIAVGTTALRVLESAADDQGVLRPMAAPTSIFITPGYRFKCADGLMTNFHLPRSTLFMLVSALAGLDRMKAVYAHAIASGYRFYSYGDASLLWRA